MLTKQDKRSFPEPDCRDLIGLFNGLFEGENTCLVRGDGEPVYLPASPDGKKAQVIFAHGFFASALHEVAHWLIAGARRRQLLDYGYWYEPDGRTAEQQVEFERVEVKPQAMEWILSHACGVRFRISVDNLSGESTDSGPFKQAVLHQVQVFCAQGLEARARLLVSELCEYYGSSNPLQVEQYTLSELD
ncbi:MAG: elongation factor P hydroxylase [Pseudomonadales bacterium]